MNDIFTKENLSIAIADAEIIAKNNDLAEIAEFFSEFMEETNGNDKKIVSNDDKDSKKINELTNKANDIADSLVNATNVNDIARLISQANRFVSSLPPAIALKISYIVESAITKSKVKIQNITSNITDNTENYKTDDLLVSQEIIDKALAPIRDCLDKLSKGEDISGEDFGKIKKLNDDEKFKEDFDKSNKNAFDDRKKFKENQNLTLDEIEQQKEQERELHNRMKIKAAMHVSDFAKEKGLSDDHSLHLVNHVTKNMKLKETHDETIKHFKEITKRGHDFFQGKDNSFSIDNMKQDRSISNKKFEDIISNSGVKESLSKIKISSIENTDQSKDKSASKNSPDHNKKSVREKHGK